MSWIIAVLLLCNLVVPVAFTLNQCISRGKIDFNHVLLFTIGYVVYWVAPIAVGESRLFLTATGMPLWYGLFDRIPQATIALYLVMSLGVYLAYGLGIIFCRRLYPGSRTEIKRVFFDRRLLNFFLLLGSAAAAIYVVILRNDFFHGYALGDVGASIGPRGTLSAISIFLLSLAILYSLKMQQDQPGISFRRAISHHFFVIYFLVALLVLSLGGRLYFVSSLVMLLVYRSVCFDKVGLRAFLVFGAATLSLAGFVGALRLGASVSVSDGLFGLAVEPLFNSFSLIQFLVDGRFDWINLPIFLMGDFLNLVPSVLLPDKAALLLNPEDAGYHIFSPEGSLSSFFSFMVNFGILGTLVFMFLTGFFLQFLRSRGRSLLAKTIYIMVCGWLATTFFRDPFSVSLVKSIFQYSILFPAIIVFMAGLVTFWLVEAPRRAAAQEVSELQ